MTATLTRKMKLVTHRARRLETVKRRAGRLVTKAFDRVEYVSHEVADLEDSVASLKRTLARRQEQLVQARRFQARAVQQANRTMERAAEVITYHDAELAHAEDRYGKVVAITPVAKFVPTVVPHDGNVYTLSGRTHELVRDFIGGNVSGVLSDDDARTLLDALYGDITSPRPVDSLGDVFVVTLQKKLVQFTINTDLHYDVIRTAEGW